MKVILYMATTANGMIARANDDTDWVSPNEWKQYSQIIKKAGNVIIGRRTYEVMRRNNEFKRLGDVKVVVVSKTLKASKGITIAKSPREAITFLQMRGFTKIMVCGGSQLNSSFLKDKLIDEIYLDVEPIFLGRGILLFANANVEAKLKLVGVKRAAQGIQLQYKVKRLSKGHNSIKSLYRQRLTSPTVIIG